MSAIEPKASIGVIDDIDLDDDAQTLLPPPPPRSLSLPPPPPAPAPVQHIQSPSWLLWTLASLALAVAAAALVVHFVAAGTSGPKGDKGDKGDQGLTGSFADPTSSLTLQYSSATRQVVDVALDELAMSSRSGLVQLHRAAADNDMLLSLGIARAAAAGLTVDSTTRLLRVCGSTNQLCNVFFAGGNGQLALFANPALLPSAAQLTANGTGFVPTRADNTYCATRGTTRSGVSTCYLKADLVGPTAAASARFLSDAADTVVALGPDDRGRALIQTGKSSDMLADVPLLVNPLGGVVHIGTESPATLSASDVKLAVNGSVQAAKAYFSSLVTAAALSVSAGVATVSATITGDLTVGGSSTLNTLSVGSAPASSHIVVLDTQGDLLVRGSISYTETIGRIIGREKCVTDHEDEHLERVLSLRVGSTSSSGFCLKPHSARRLAREHGSSDGSTLDLYQLVLSLTASVQALEKRVHALEKNK